MSINPDRKGFVMNQSYDVLLICSGGGHWVQMSKLLPAFDGQKVNIATVDTSVRSQYPLHDFVKVPDFNRSEPFKIIKGFCQIFNIVYQSKAKYVISTGAAPGLLGLITAKIMGKKTLWIDSIANPKKISLSGRIASCFVDEILTQWPTLSENGRAQYKGRVV
jgi:UDP-N-acetylglucosamine:LPS N-acetylglucosamine transferase